MSSFSVCPDCCVPGIKVNNDSVAAFSSNKNIKDDKNKWQACINPQCPTAYYSKGNDSILVESLKRPLWYKQPAENSDIICYCAKITRGDIQEAVKKGCKSVKDVRKKTGKDKSGSCSKTHPLGKCCKEAFKQIVENSVKNGG